MEFSVIVPIYNVERFIKKCIDSILAQTFNDFEVILVDDGSPDGCPQICDDYEKKDKRVRVIHKPNGGLVSARNVGILAAKGDYITYVDGDDWIKPNLLQFVHDRILESSTPVDMVLFASENIYSDHITETHNKVQEGWYNRERLEKEVFPYLLSDRRRGFSIADMIQGHTWNKPCRRELQIEHYVRDERIRMFTDVPMTYECLLNCNNVYICNEPLYMYNQTNANSILAIGKQNYLTESFGYLVSYLQNRLKGYSTSINQQLNDYPVLLIIKTVMWEIQNTSSFRLAVKNVKIGMKKSGMLQYIRLKGLPIVPRIIVLMFKLNLYTLTMLPFLLKTRMTSKY